MFYKLIKRLTLADYFSGIQAKIVQTVLYNAFLLVFYEKIRAAVKFFLFLYVLKTRGNKYSKTEPFIRS